MFDLQAGIHLEEVEMPVGAQDELDGAGGIVADSFGQRDRLRAHLGAQRRIDRGRRRLLDDLLVAPLDGAFALAEMDDGAVAVAEHLDFHMARILDELLDEDAVVAEGGARLGAGGAHALRHLTLVPRDAHALAAAAGRSLDDHRHAELTGGSDRRGVAVDGTAMAGDGRHPGFGRQLLRIRSCRRAPRWRRHWGR